MIVCVCVCVPGQVIQHHLSPGAVGCPRVMFQVHDKELTIADRHTDRCDRQNLWAGSGYLEATAPL